MYGAERVEPRPGVSKHEVYERKANPVVPGILYLWTMQGSNLVHPQETPIIF